MKQDKKMPYGAMEVVGDGWRYDPLDKQYHHRDGTCVSYYILESELEKYRNHNHMAKIVEMKKNGEPLNIVYSEMMAGHKKEYAPKNEQIVTILNNLLEE